MKTVLVYRRGAIRECYDLGWKFLPVADYQLSTWNGPVALVIDRQSIRDSIRQLYIPDAPAHNESEQT